MATCFFPLQYVIAAVALWLNRQQQEVIDYLKEENRLLKERLGDRKLQFTDAERRRLAARVQIGRNLTNADEGWFLTKRKLIIDRDTKYCTNFRTLIESGLRHRQWIATLCRIRSRAAPASA
jgi:hypothetical protein